MKLEIGDMLQIPNARDTIGFIITMFPCHGMLLGVTKLQSLPAFSRYKTNWHNANVIVVLLTTGKIAWAFSDDFG